LASNDGVSSVGDFAGALVTTGGATVVALSNCWAWARDGKRLANKRLDDKRFDDKKLAAASASAAVVARRGACVSNRVRFSRITDCRHFS
jgi:hypothetical protein